LSVQGCTLFHELQELQLLLMVFRHAATVQDGTACLAEIDTLAAGVRKSLPEAPVPLRVVQVGRSHEGALRAAAGAA